jgi:hypothetical protein
MAVTVILIMIHSNLRLTEIHRAAIDTSQQRIGILTIKTSTKKGPAGKVTVCLRRISKK